MGGQQFTKVGVGTNARDAFSKLVDQAQYQHGHGGYTGTIAEKHEFKLLALPPGVAALDMAEWVQGYVTPEYRGQYRKWDPKYPAHLEDEVRRAWKVSMDKWGPAAAYEIRGEELEALKKIKDPRARAVHDMPPGSSAYVFFGWASS